MQLLIVVLNKTERLETLLRELGEAGYTGATILDSRGMAHSLDGYGEYQFMASLRMFLDPDRRESKTIFMVLRDEAVPEVAKIVNRVTGGLNQPDTGVLFTVPVQYTEGLDPSCS